MKLLSYNIFSPYKYEFSYNHVLYSCVDKAYVKVLISEKKLEVEKI